MKQRRRARDWPNGIVEIPSTRPDPRGDPQATQKLSRAEIDAALLRTRSGTRAAVRPKSEPSLWQDEATDDAALSGPRDDDAPAITIVSIDSVEPSVSEPGALRAPSTERPTSSPRAPTSARPRAPTDARPRAPTDARPRAPTSPARTSTPASPMRADGTPASATLAERAPTETTAPSAFAPTALAEDASRVALTPRLAFVTGIALVAFITLAALIGFLAGRLSGH